MPRIIMYTIVSGLELFLDYNGKCSRIHKSRQQNTFL